MTGKIYLVAILTFFMGVVTGFYFYLTVFAPMYESDIATSESVDANAVVIEGQMQGGCLRSDQCASFKLTENGSYSYLAFSGDEVQKGNLPKEIVTSIFDYIGGNAFFNDTKVISNNSCASFYDGIDYAYTVSLGKDTYTLDTCSTAFAYDDTLQSSFIDAWKFMENPTSTYPVLLDKGVGGFLKDRFQNGGN